MAQAWYCTREQVKSALDFQETARNNTLIDRAIGAASRSINTQMHRTFYPWDGTRYFGFPQRDMPSWRLWLNENDLVSASAVTAGGVAVPAIDYFLEPVNSGPPFRSIELDLESSAEFTSGDTWQRNIAITGTWGWWDEQESVGTLSSNLDADITDMATVTWTQPRDVGVGSILKVDSERIIITEMSFVDSTQNTSGSLTASAADVTVGVTSGTGFYVGEVIRIDSERMLIVDLGTTTLTVKRAWDGSVLAAHNTGADVYGKTGIEIARAQLGSTLAAHTTPDVVYRWIVPPLINDLCVAEAMVQLQGEQSAYGKGGSAGGDMPEGSPGRGLGALRKSVYAAFGRKARHMAV